MTIRPILLLAALAVGCTSSTTWTPTPATIAGTYRCTTTSFQNTNNWQYLPSQIQALSTDVPGEVKFDLTLSSATPNGVATQLAVPNVFACTGAWLADPAVAVGDYFSCPIPLVGCPTGSECSSSWQVFTTNNGTAMPSGQILSTAGTIRTTCQQ